MKEIKDNLLLSLYINFGVETGILSKSKKAFIKHLKRYKQM
ncbi:hypothetical protein ACK2FY_09380 [Clostridioides difficile]